MTEPSKITPVPFSKNVLGAPGLSCWITFGRAPLKRDSGLLLRRDKHGQELHLGEGRTNQNFIATWMQCLLTKSEQGIWKGL